MSAPQWMVNSWNYIDTRIEWKKILGVGLAIVVTVGGALGLGSLVGNDKQLLVAGAIVAAIGKLTEIARKTKDVSAATDEVKDGFALFGEGATFFGLLATALGAVFAFET